MPSGEQSVARRLPRAQRREQILAAATQAFARAGYAATGLAEVAAEAGVSQVILYRHFASKAELYRAVLDGAAARLHAAVGSEDFDETSIPTLVRAAAADPDGFRLLFRFVSREPEFRDVVDALRLTSTEVTRRNLANVLPAGPWREWAALVLPIVTLEAVIAWLDAGQPAPEAAADRITAVVRAVLAAAG